MLKIANLFGIFVCFVIISASSSLKGEVTNVRCSTDLLICCAMRCRICGNPGFIEMRLMLGKYVKE